MSHTQQDGTSVPNYMHILAEELLGQMEILIELALLKSERAGFVQAGEIFRKPEEKSEAQKIYE